MQIFYNPDDMRMTCARYPSPEISISRVQEGANNSILKLTEIMPIHFYNIITNSIYKFNLLVGRSEFFSTADMRRIIKSNIHFSFNSVSQARYAINKAIYIDDVLNMMEFNNNVKNFLCDLLAISEDPTDKWLGSAILSILIRGSHYNV